MSFKFCLGIQHSIGPRVSPHILSDSFFPFVSSLHQLPSRSQRSPSPHCCPSPTLAGWGSPPVLSAEDPQVEGSAPKGIVFIANGSSGPSEVAADLHANGSVPQPALHSL